MRFLVLHSGWAASRERRAVGRLPGTGANGRHFWPTALLFDARDAQFLAPAPASLAQFEA